MIEETCLESVFVFALLYFCIARWVVCGKHALMWKKKIGLSWHDRVRGLVTAVTGVFVFLYLSMSGVKWFVTFSLFFFVFDNVIVLRLHTLWFGICKLGFPLRWKMFVAIFLGEFCCEISTTICITSLILLVSPSILNLLFFLQSWWRGCRWNGPIFTLEVHSSSHYLDASSI